MVLPEGFSGMMVATPCYGGVVTNAYMQSALRLAIACLEKQVTCEIVTSPGDSLVQRARNTLASVFLASKHSHLLFIDADIEFHARDALRLLVADKDLICGIYPKKSISLEFPLNFLPGSSERLNRCPRSGAIEIMEGPTGFMMISRRVFEVMMAAHPEWKYRGPDHLDEPQQAMCHSFFDCERRGDAYLSEDFTFCQRWRALGGQVWALPDIELRHHGMHAFGGVLTSWLSETPLPEAA